MKATAGSDRATPTAFRSFDRIAVARGLAVPDTENLTKMGNIYRCVRQSLAGAKRPLRVQAGTVRVKSILAFRAGPRVTSLFLLENRQSDGRVLTPKIGYTQLL